MEPSLMCLQHLAAAFNHLTYIFLQTAEATEENTSVSFEVRLKPLNCYP